MHYSVYLVQSPCFYVLDYSVNFNCLRRQIRRRHAVNRERDVARCGEICNYGQCAAVGGNNNEPTFRLPQATIVKVDF